MSGAPSIDLIQSEVAAHFRVKVSDLKSQYRHRSVAHPRAVAMYLVRHITSASYPEIGKQFGGKDHSTVIAAVRKVERKMKVDESLLTIVAHLWRRIMEASGKGSVVDSSALQKCKVANVPEEQRQPENNYGWVRLPETTTLTCCRCSTGWSRDEDDKDRCGKPATWMRKATCNCGMCDMTRWACSDCLVIEMMAECSRRDRTIEKAIDKVREQDKEIPSRNMALMAILGIDQYPPDDPDEYFRRNHPATPGDT